jgi:hypothetical protein
MTSTTPAGGFHRSAMLAGISLPSFFFLSSTPCFAFENSRRIGYARPPSSVIRPRYSVSSPDLTQASISAV